MRCVCEVWVGVGVVVGVWEWNAQCSKNENPTRVVVGEKKSEYDL